MRYGCRIFLHFIAQHKQRQSVFLFERCKSNSCEHKIPYQKKFEKKLVVWLVFSEKGMAEPYFIPSGLAVNQIIYLEECTILMEIMHSGFI